MKALRWLLPLAATAAAAVGVYAVFIERRWIQVRRTRIHVPNLPPQLESLTIGLLSDLHAGPLTPLDVIVRSVRMLAAEKPDLIAVTGDLSDDERNYFEDVVAVLATLRAPLGVHLVPGNHDYTLGIGRWHGAVRRYPSLSNLTNRSIVLDVAGARICVAGVDDYYHGRPEMRLPPRAERDFTILLAHTPDQGERARRPEDAVDLIVSGHTHGGQVRLPWIGAPLRAAKHHYDEGLRRRPWTQVYTTRGIGSVHLPLRFMARPEIALLELTAAPRPPRAVRRGARLAPFRAGTERVDRVLEVP
jgi:uncharacterized protein